MNKDEIKAWLDKYGIGNYTINEDLTVDVDGNVDLFKKKLYKIPIQFNEVKGYFNCACNQLKSLKGSPKIINDYFSCNTNKLISLKFGPNIIKGDIICYKNELLSLDYLPIIYGVLYCDDWLKGNIQYKQWKLLKALKK